MEWKADLEDQEHPATVIYLFCFGFESPVEWRLNQKEGTDFESSEVVWVHATSREEALRLGCRYADRLVGELFAEEGVDLPEPWSEIGYACWIEEDPKEVETARQESIPETSAAALDHADTAIRDSGS